MLIGTLLPDLSAIYCWISSRKHRIIVGFKVFHFSGWRVQLRLRVWKEKYLKRWRFERGTSRERAIMATGRNHSNAPFSRKHTEILHALYHLNNHQRAALFEADSKLVRSICECALKIIYGSVPLNQRQRSRLRKHAKLLRKLADSKCSLHSKKKIISQRGRDF